MATVSVTIAVTLPKPVIAEAGVVHKLHEQTITEVWGGVGKRILGTKPRASKPRVSGIRSGRLR